MKFVNPLKGTQSIKITQISYHFRMFTQIMNNNKFNNIRISYIKLYTLKLKKIKRLGLAVIWRINIPLNLTTIDPITGDTFSLNIWAKKHDIRIQ